MIQYSALQNCIVQYSVIKYNTELPCNVHHCTTVQLSALHDTVQDNFIYNSAGVSSKPKMGTIWKVHSGMLENLAERSHPHFKDKTPPKLEIEE